MPKDLQWFSIAYHIDPNSFVWLPSFFVKFCHSFVLLNACCFLLLTHMHTHTWMCTHTLLPWNKAVWTQYACFHLQTDFCSCLNCVKCVFSPFIYMVHALHNLCNLPWCCLWIFLLLTSFIQFNCTYSLCHAVEHLWYVFVRSRGPENMS